MRRVGVLTLLAVLSCAVPHSATAATLMGSGVMSCGGWVESRKGLPNKPLLEEWALGYLSGVAIWSPESPLENVDAAGVFVWLDNACQSQPLEPFKAALDAFIRTRSVKPPPAPAAGRPPAAPGPARPR